MAMCSCKKKKKCTTAELHSLCHLVQGYRRNNDMLLGVERTGM